MAAAPESHQHTPLEARPGLHTHPRQYGRDGHTVPLLLRDNPAFLADNIGRLRLRRQGVHTLWSVSTRGCATRSSTRSRQASGAASPAGSGCDGSASRRSGCTDIMCPFLTRSSLWCFPSTSCRLLFHHTFR